MRTSGKPDGFIYKQNSRKGCNAIGTCFKGNVNSSVTATLLRNIESALKALGLCNEIGLVEEFTNHGWHIRVTMPPVKGRKLLNSIVNAFKRVLREMGIVKNPMECDLQRGWKVSLV